MKKAQILKLVEVTSQRQADNGTVCYHDPLTGCDYLSYESGYVRRKYSSKNWRGNQINTIYQLNRKRLVQVENPYNPGKFWEKNERVLVPNHEDRMEIIYRAVINYRKGKQALSNNSMSLEKRSTLTAIQDEINQYHQGNLTIDMAINGIKELINQI